MIYYYRASIIIKGCIVNNAITKMFIRTPLYRIPYFIRTKNRAKEIISLPPSFIDIESTNACNAKCNICPHKKMRRKIGNMEWTLFKKIADDCARSNVRNITLNGFGEPLLDPLLSDRIKYLKKVGIPNVFMYTNGSLLDRVTLHYVMARLIYSI